MKTRTLVNLICIISLFIVTTPAFPQEKTVFLNNSPCDSLLTVRIVEQDMNHTRIEIRLNGFEVKERSLYGAHQHTITIPGTVPGYESGDRALPQLYRTIQIPDLADVTYRVLKSEQMIFGGYDIMPSEIQILGTDSPPLNKNSGKNNLLDPESFTKQFSLFSPAIIRDVRTIKFCFNPFRHNPDSRELTVTTHFTVDIKYSAENPGSEKAAAAGYEINNYKTSGSIYTPVFESVYPKVILNYNPELSGSYSLAKKDAEINGFRGDNMIIVTTPEYESALKEYVLWKKSRGINVEVNSKSAENGADAVQKILQDKYDKDGLTYIVLVGDIDDVPSHMPDAYGAGSGYASDPSYALLEGDDKTGDALISRISVNSVKELKNQLNKIMIHEKGNFKRKKGIYNAVVASMTGFDGINHSNSIEKAMKDNPDYFKNVIKIMESDTRITEKIKNAIEKTGVNIIAHHGHGSQTGFESIPFKAEDAKKLKNTDGPFPMIHGAACATGSFQRSGGDCLAEAFLKAGTVDQPAGAVAFLGASSGMNPYACCLAQKEAFTNLYYKNGEETYGALCYEATLFAMNRLNNTEANRLYKKWHLFGDCSTLIWKKALGKKAE